MFVVTRDGRLEMYISIVEELKRIGMEGEK